MFQARRVVSALLVVVTAQSLTACAPVMAGRSDWTRAPYSTDVRADQIRVVTGGAGDYALPHDMVPRPRVTDGHVEIRSPANAGETAVLTLVNVGALVGFVVTNRDWADSLSCLVPEFQFCWD